MYHQSLKRENSSCRLAEFEWSLEEFGDGGSVE